MVGRDRPRYAAREPGPDPECPTCEPSRTDSVGFYGKRRGRRLIGARLAHFAIVGEIAERVDTDEVNGVGGALSDSVIEGLYIQHTKVGIWLDGPGRGPAGARQRDRRPDGGRHQHPPRLEAARARRTASSATWATTRMAMWSNEQMDVGNTFDHNTIQTPVLANGITIYGGRDNIVSDNLVADPVREGSALHAGYRMRRRRSPGRSRSPATLSSARGTRELNWDIGLGAIWFYALEGDMDATSASSTATSSTSATTRSSSSPSSPCATTSTGSGT